MGNMDLGDHTLFGVPQAHRLLTFDLELHQTPWSSQALYSTGTPLKKIKL